MNNQSSHHFLALDRAESTLESSEYDLKGGFILATVNRAYYAVYYCMSALLFTENVYAKSHKGTLVKYDELFVKTGKMPQKTSNFVRDSFNLRQDADYDFEININEAEAQILIDNAREFFNLTKDYIRKLNV